MASAAGVAGVRATQDLGSKSSQCVHSGEPDSARITGYLEVMPLGQYRETAAGLGNTAGTSPGARVRISGHHADLNGAAVAADAYTYS
jgi:hypothetical protein